MFVGISSIIVWNSSIFVQIFVLNVCMSSKFVLICVQLVCKKDFMCAKSS